MRSHRANVWLAESLVALSARSLALDRSRVYSVGMSNGGFMSVRLGCVNTAIFAAIASGESRGETRETIETMLVLVIQYRCDDLVSDSEHLRC
jgi:poly(3-hydroxybutyrate) depolymerase